MVGIALLDALVMGGIFGAAGIANLGIDARL